MLSAEKHVALRDSVVPFLTSNDSLEETILSIYETWWTRGMQEKFLWGWPHLLRIVFTASCSVGAGGTRGTAIALLHREANRSNLFAKMYVKS